ncbi:Lrp/AsnC family transcriptional regulator [archaeon]|nr:Lrp/AsnC family transcriptional regulator [archaeon]
MDDLDTEILSLLSRDGRMPYRKMAKKLRVSEGTIYNRVDSLVEQKLIQRFTIKPDHEAMGFDLTALFGLRIKGGSLEEVEEKVSKVNSVLAVYDITGDYDAMVVAKFKNRKELNKFVKYLLSLPQVERSYTFFVLNTIKENFNLTDLD